MLVVCDLRGPMFFGSQRLKSVVACEISAALAWAGLSANDRVGGLVFGAQQQAEVKSRRSHHAVLQYIHQLQDFSQQLLAAEPQTNLALAAYSRRGAALCPARHHRFYCQRLP